MKALMKTTKPATPATVDKKWVLIDAEGLVVGRRRQRGDGFGRLLRGGVLGLGRDEGEGRRWFSHLLALAGTVEREADSEEARESARYPATEFGIGLGMKRTLRDWEAAEKRGVKVRIVLDTGQQHAFGRMHALADNIRIKRSRVYMHMKAYTVDGMTLRAGAANFSASGLKHQDNELVIIRDATAVHQFRARFESLWTDAVPLYDHDRAVRQMEPR